MRIRLLLVPGLLALLLGNTCLPLIDNVTRTPADVDSTTLSIVIVSPSTDTSVPQGSTVVIRWTAANLTGETATVSLTVESRRDLSVTTLVADAPADGTDGLREYSWETGDFSGEYVLRAELATPSQTASATADGRVTVDPPPTFNFTGPTTDQSIDLGESPVREVTISWIGGDNNGTARIGIDPDLDHGDGGDNEVFIRQIELPDPSSEGTLDWDGTDENGDAVDADSYYVFALLSDGINPDQTVGLEFENPDTGGVIPIRITVTGTGSGTDPALEFTKPVEDETFLTSEVEHNIIFEVNQSSKVRVDMKADTDPDHTNGNERTIRTVPFTVEPGDPSVTHPWNGQDTNGDDDPGIYYILAVMSTGSGTPQIFEADGVIFRRDSDNQPLIALWEPAATQTVDPGDFIHIKWRDDDPLGEDEDDPTPSAKIHIVLDDDGDPATAGDQITILQDWDAAGDGVDDTLDWQVPSGTLTQGEDYTVIAYIDRGGIGNHSVAAGLVILRDPTP